MSGSRGGLSNSYSARKAFKPPLPALGPRAPSPEPDADEEEPIEVDTDDDFDRRLEKGSDGDGPARRSTSPMQRILQPLENEPEVPRRQETTKTGKSVGRTSSKASLNTVSRTASRTSMRERAYTRICLRAHI